MIDIKKNVEQSQGVSLSKSLFQSYMTQPQEDLTIKKVENSPYIRKHRSLLDIFTSSDEEGL